VPLRSGAASGVRSPPTDTGCGGAEIQRQDAGLKPGATFAPKGKDLRSEDLSYIERKVKRAGPSQRTRGESLRDSPDGPGATKGGGSPSEEVRTRFQRAQHAAPLRSGAASGVRLPPADRELGGAEMQRQDARLKAAATKAMRNAKARCRAEARRYEGKEKCKGKTPACPSFLRVKGRALQRRRERQRQDAGLKPGATLTPKGKDGFFRASSSPQEVEANSRR